MDIEDRPIHQMDLFVAAIGETGGMRRLLLDAAIAIEGRALPRPEAALRRLTRVELDAQLAKEER